MTELEQDIESSFSRLKVWNSLNLTPNLESTQKLHKIRIFFSSVRRIFRTYEYGQDSLPTLSDEIHSIALSFNAPGHPSVHVLRLDCQRRFLVRDSNLGRMPTLFLPSFSCSCVRDVFSAVVQDGEVS